MALNAGLAIDIISQAALRGFNAIIQPLNSFSVDMSADALRQAGDTIKFTWTPAGGTVTDYNADNGYVTEEPSQLPKTLEIDKNKYVGFEYTDDQLATMGMLKLEEIGVQYGAALAQAVLADVWSIITAGNFANSFVKAAALYDSDEILDLGKACTKLNFPAMGRNAIFDEDVYTELAKDPAVKNAAAAGGTEALRQGVVPNLGTFEGIFQSTVIPANGENLIGFAVNKEAIGIAFRPVTPDASSDNVMRYEVATNDSGMTIAFKEWYDTKYKKTRRILEVNYGKCVGNGAALVRCVSA